MLVSGLAAGAARSDFEEGTGKGAPHASGGFLISFAACWFRWAEDALVSELDRGEAGTAVTELFEFLTGFGGKRLENEVRALARRAHIDLADRYLSDPYGLTEREREVLTHMARGATNRPTAETRNISEKTASVHVSNIPPLAHGRQPR